VRTRCDEIDEMRDNELIIESRLNDEAETRSSHCLCLIIELIIETRLNDELIVSHLINLVASSSHCLCLIIEAMSSSLRQDEMKDEMR